MIDEVNHKKWSKDEAEFKAQQGINIKNKYGEHSYSEESGHIFWF